MNIIYEEDEDVDSPGSLESPEETLAYLLANNEIEDQYTIYLKPQFSGDEYPPSRIFFGEFDYEFLNNFEHL